MTVNQLAQILVREQAEKQGDTNFIGMVENWIASALKVIALKSNWKFFKKEFSFNTVPSQQEYNLPEEARQVIWLQLSNTDTKLIYREKRKQADLRIDFEQLGTPKFWSYADNIVSATNPLKRISLQPTPPSVIPVIGEYYFHPINITTSYEIPLDESFDEIIQCYVRSKMMKIDKNYAGATLEMQDFNSLLNTAIVMERQKPAEELVNEPTDIPSARMFNHRLRYTWE